MPPPPPPPPPPRLDKEDYNKLPPPQPFPPIQENINVQQFPPPPPPFPPPYLSAPAKPDKGHSFTPPLHPIPQPQPQPATGLQPWKTELYDCMKNPRNALFTCFFPCVTFGQIAEIVDNGSTSCTTSGMMYTVVPCFAMPYRSKMRRQFGLVESPASDFLIHIFCECCALCQEYRELQQRGFDPSIGWSGNVAKMQQRQQQFGMTPPMQQRMF